MSNKQFVMTHRFFKKESRFDENTAPDWLTGENTVRGSTMDTRWVFKEHILTLAPGAVFETDFHEIKRVA